MRIPDQLQRAVVFVGFTAGGEDQYRATAFLLGIPATDGLGTFTYIVTARHVANNLEGRRFWVSVNTKDGSLVKLEGEDVRWWYHRDDAVDVAVHPLVLPAGTEAAFLPASMFVTDLAEKSIGLGDETFMLGLFAPAMGVSRNVPIVRTGNIAMLAGHPLRLKDGTKAEVYLIEARSIGGLSGSPVFVRQTVQVIESDTVPVYGLGPTFFLGLMHGHWDIPMTELNSGDPLVQQGGVNMGVGIVVPASKILEALDHPELVRMQNDVEHRRAGRRLPSPDLPTESESKRDRQV